jgi:hypothetical protein
MVWRRSVVVCLSNLMDVGGNLHEGGAGLERKTEVFAGIFATNKTQLCMRLTVLTIAWATGL